MSDTPASPSRCEYCNNLKYGDTGWFAFHNWLSGISSSACQTCEIVFKAIRKLYPAFLDSPHPDAMARLSVLERCLVTIQYVPAEKAIRTVDFQLYYSRNEAGQ